MICPSCKNEIPEGKLYCPSCGKAIQIVPDFEPDIEEKIELSKSDIEVAMTGRDENKDPTVDLSGDTKELPGKTDPDPSAMDNIARRKQQRSKNKISLTFKIVSVLILILASVSVFIILRKRVSNSYSAHMKKAVDSMAAEDYEGAVSEYLAAAAKEGLDPKLAENAALGAANAYHYSKDDEKAIEILMDMLEKNPASKECYEQLIAIYEEEGDIIAINELISSCPVSEIYEEYKDYITLPPEFSTLGGEYPETVELELTAGDGNSDIYYTIDGSIPDENSEKYTKAIILSEGSYIISAVCINKKGYSSAVISEEYTVTRQIPDMPEVSPEGGNKALPENITAKAGEDMQIYYTDDGSDPDLDSTKYEGEIPMPLGKSEFKFVAADSNGNLSEVVTVSYKLNLMAAFTPADGVNYLLVNLVNTGKLMDVQGHAYGQDGVYKYSCDSCFSSGSRIYYMIYESYESGGKEEATGKIYALDFKTLELYRAGRDKDGNFTFEMFY